MAVKKETVEKVKEVAKKTTKKAEEVAEKAVKTAKPKVEKATKAASEAVKNATSKVKEEVFVEFGGKSVLASDIIEKVKADYKASGNKAAIKKIQVYIKPEDGCAYYVINGVAEGKKVEF